MGVNRFINYITNKMFHININISEEIPSTYLLAFCFERAIMFIRGFFLTGLRKKGKMLFIGKRVKIQCKSKLSVGNCVSFQDEVQINALSQCGIVLGNNVSIGKRSTIKTSGSLTAVGKGFSMGDNSAMANDCFVGAAGGVSIGEYVAIGQNVRFHSENHEFHDRNKRISEQGVTNKGIAIGNDCWIGAGAVFLDGVHVGSGCVIGANTLVNKDIPDYAIAVGNPVKIIGYREE